jgi:hypothetical protein
MITALAPSGLLQEGMPSMCLRSEAKAKAKAKAKVEGEIKV